MKHFPGFRGRLAESWHAYSIWSRATPHVTRLGLDEVVPRAMVVVWSVWNWRRTAAAWLIGFYALPRPGELVAASERTSGYLVTGLGSTVCRALSAS